MISGKGKTIAVAGTHGKTTTATLIAHILKVAGIDFMAFLGGISKNYGSNFISSSTHQFAIHQRIRASVHQLISLWKLMNSINPSCSFNPSIAVITSADADHLDIYGSLR